MQSLKGQFILDGGRLVGSDFQRTVVLVCEHDANGAFGLVVNRPTEITLQSCLKQPLPEAFQERRLYIGGPVRPQALTCLVRDPDQPDEIEGAVLPGLRFTSQLDDLLASADAPEPSVQIRFFAGYAGWAPGQLDQEMKAQAWLTHPATAQLVFHSAPETLWKMILRSKGPTYRLIAEAPDDVSQN